MKKKMILGLSAVIIVAAMAVGGTLAYFTNTDNAENTFTVGSVELDLFEHQVSKITGDDGMSVWEYVTRGNQRIEVEENVYDGVYPGAILPKDPTIRNIGTNPAYVRIKVTISNASAWKRYVASGSDLSIIFGGFDGTKWTRANIEEDPANDTITYIYNFSAILAAGSETGALFSSVTIPSAFDNAEMSAIGGEHGRFTMQITAEAIQAEGFNGNASAAFAALDGQLTSTPPTPPAPPLPPV